MKKQIITILVGLMMSGAMMAEVFTINPTWEGDYRTNKNDPDNWTTVTTDAEQFEVCYNSRFFAIQTWRIEHISKVTSLEFVYERVSGQTNKGDVAMWAFPYNNMVTSTDDWSKSDGSFIYNVKDVLGVYPGAIATNAPLKKCTERSATGYYARIITLGSTEIEALKTAGTITDDVLTVNVLLYTMGDESNTQNYKYYHSGEKASYCNVTRNVIKNETTSTEYGDLSSAVSAASASDVLTLFDDVTSPSSRLDITKTLTIQGATGGERIICGVEASSIMILANGDTEHTLTFKDLIIDGKNVSRSKQTLEAANKASICLDGVRFVNTLYSEVCGDVKNTGDKQVVFTNSNVIPNGVYLNKNKRVKHDGATHTDPIKIYLADDYVQETYSIVLTCSDPTLYIAEQANGAEWQLFKKEFQNELAGRVWAAHSTNLTIGEALMATLVLGYNCEIPDGLKAYKLTNEGEPDIYAKEQMSIKRNEPVLIIADAAGSYTFETGTGVRLDEQANPESGCLRGTYSESPIAVPNNDGAGTYNYILTKVGDEVGFYHANSDGTNTVTKNHAYLFTTYNAVPPAPGAPARRMRLVFDSEEQATGIHDAVVSEKAEKLLIDGVLYIRKADHLYRIDGQIVK